MMWEEGRASSGHSKQGSFILSVLGELRKGCKQNREMPCVSLKSFLSILCAKWVVGGRKEIREGQENTAVVLAEGDGII